MNFVFLADRVERFNLKKDTTIIMMQCAASRGHRVFALERNNTSFIEDKTVFKVRELIFEHVKNQAIKFSIRSEVELSQTEVDVIFIRTDPPFDNNYLVDTWLLDSDDKDFPIVLNSPQGLRNINEKIWQRKFTDLIAPTIITCRLDEYKAFLAKHKKIVVKPTDGFGGSSVFIVSLDEPNANVVFETLTNSFQKYVIVQKYLSAAKNGDKRILLLDGKILGALTRLHGEADHRNNFAQGATAQKTELTTRDKEIVERLHPHLTKEGIYFAGLDIIGDYLIEVNVTSPTTIQEANRLYDKNLEVELIIVAENRVKDVRLRS